MDGFNEHHKIGSYSITALQYKNYTMGYCISIFSKALSCVHDLIFLPTSIFNLIKIQYNVCLWAMTSYNSSNFCYVSAHNAPGSVINLPQVPIVVGDYF